MGTCFVQGEDFAAEFPPNSMGPYAKKLPKWPLLIKMWPSSCVLCRIWLLIEAIEQCTSQAPKPRSFAITLSVVVVIKADGIEAIKKCSYGEKKCFFQTPEFDLKPTCLLQYPAGVFKSGLRSKIRGKLISLCKFQIL